MKKIIRQLTSILTLSVFVITLTNSCKKDEQKIIPKTITDIDGNVYHTIIIGTQVWLTENLKVKHFRNGDSIPNITIETQWNNLQTGGYCDYNNNPTNSITYGRLYNWFAVNGTRKITPIGWHIPTEAEWTVLIDYLGGDSIAGGSLKDTGFIHWNKPNTGATNVSGFTGLAGGYHDYLNGLEYVDIGNYGYWWSSTMISPFGRICYIKNDESIIWRRYGDVNNAYAVRCIMD